MFRRKFTDRLREKYQQGGTSEGGGLSKLGSLGLKALASIPKVARLAGSSALTPLSLMLGSNKAYASPVIDTKTGINSFTGEQEYRPFLSNRQTGGMYNQMQQYQEGGKYPHNMYHKKTGYKIVAEDAEAHNALSKDFDHNKMMGGGMYEQMQQYQSGGEKEETRREKNQRIKNYTHPYLDQYYDKFAETGYGGGNISDKKQVRNILSEMNITPSDTAFIGSSNNPRVLNNEVEGQLNRYMLSQMSDKNVDITNLSRSTRMPFFSSEPSEDGKSYSFMQNKYYNDLSTRPTLLDPRPAPGSVTKVLKSKKQTGGMYDQMRQYQEGGMQLPGVELPGGVVEPIPGSDAVEFSGADHDEGGIMMDPQTEVEDGETMDQVTMAKKGGKRDYFFSSHLKKGGRSYADMHKDILANGGSQEEINMLAKMQEVAAGRNPKQVAKLGGIVNYQTGGLTQKQKEENLALALQQDNTGYEEDFNELQNYTNYVKDVAPEGNMEGVLGYEEWAKMQKQVGSGPTETIDYAELDRLALEELKGKARKKGEKGRGVPTEAYVGMGAQLLPAAYAFLHKQKKPEKVDYTPGFTSPVVSSTVKSQKLDRVNYNDKRSNLTSSIRGMNKFIETSGGGPANIANLQATLAKDIAGQMTIDAAETKANIAIDNTEKQLAQQVALDNVKRSQAASQFNAQMSRAEAARADSVEGINVAAQNKWQSDQELNRMNALISTAQGISGGAGDIMSYKAGERMAQAVGTEGIYKRDIMRDFIKKRAAKDGIPGVCDAGDCTEEQINQVVATAGATA